MSFLAFRRLGLSGRIRILRRDIYETNLANATLVYSGLTEDEGDLQFYEQNLRAGCSLITLALPLIGVMPNAQNYPFYLMKTPFKKTKSVSGWIRKLLSKNATVEEFFTELDLDPTTFMTN